MSRDFPMTVITITVCFFKNMEIASRCLQLLLCLANYLLSIFESNAIGTFFTIFVIYKNFLVLFGNREISLRMGIRSPKSITAYTFVRTPIQFTFGRFTRMLVYPILEPTHGVPRWDTTSNAQCALRDSLGVSGRGFSPSGGSFKGCTPRVYAC